MTQTVHPAYYPKTGVWRTMEPRAEARSLRELQKKLGAVWKIEGYFPNGFTAPPRPTGSNTMQRILIQPSVASTMSRPRYYPNPPHPKREEVLDLWVLGISSSKIAAQLGLKTGEQVTSMVSTAREAGDKRAVRRHRAMGQ